MEWEHCETLGELQVSPKWCKRAIVEWSGLVLSNKLNDDLISVNRKSDRVMSIELGLQEVVVNII